MSNVIDINSFKRLRDLHEQMHSAKPNPTGSPGKVPRNDEFGDRMRRIRTSLEKINQLMQELKNKEPAQTKGLPE